MGRASSAWLLDRRPLAIRVQILTGVSNHAGYGTHRLGTVALATPFFGPRAVPNLRRQSCNPDAAPGLRGEQMDGPGAAVAMVIGGHTAS